MICPRCGKKVSQEVIKCPNCKFDLNGAFNEFHKREKRIHNKIMRIRINNDKKIYEDRIKLTDYLFKITDTPSFNDSLTEFNISHEEWNCLQFKIISEIYLNRINKKSQVKNKLGKLLESYGGEYELVIDVLSKNLTNLIRLAGVNPFSKYYLYQLNDYKLSIIEGLEVLGKVMEDLLCGEIKLEDLDFKIKCFMKQTVNNPIRLKYVESLNNAIKEYFVLTGRDYFSLSFENKLLKYDFTIDDAYNIKELFLKKIIINNSRKNLESKLNSVIYSYFSNSNQFIEPDSEKLILEGDSYVYYDSMAIGKGLIKNRKKKNKKRKNKSIDYDPFIPIQSEELGGDENSYDDWLDFEKEILGDF